MAAGSAGAPEVFGEKGSLGVVVVHEVFGRDGYVRSVAESLAHSGYPATTVDLYGGQQATDLEAALRLRSNLTDEGVLARIDEARIAVQRRLVPHARIGTLGFCMGGGYALYAATQRPFQFVVDYYGRIDRADDVAGLSGPALLILASEDERVTPWAFAELLPAAARWKKRATVELYPGVRHAFHRPGWEGHDPATAARAWQRTLEFLGEVAAHR
ncbi:MAG TPA: dienelactone hydrolase family protein [Thermoplasmata archaeon]|nr:dienelactone hydrolase family protein [Thermoplasmata archaeon]